MNDKSTNYTQKLLLLMILVKKKASPRTGGGGDGECRVHTACTHAPGGALPTQPPGSTSYLETAEIVTFLEPALPTFAPV